MVQQLAGKRGGDAHHLPEGVWLLLFTTVLLSLLTANPLLSCTAIGILPVLVRLTWRAGEPPVLFFAVAFQWLQVSMAVFYADFMGQSVSSFPNSPATATAVFISLVGLVVLAIGMKIGLDWRQTKKHRHSVAGPMRYSMKKVWSVYLFLFTMTVFLPPLLWKVQSVRTIMLAFLSLKWVSLYILAYLSCARSQGVFNRYLAVCILLEVIIGFTGYFSGYKQVFFMLGIAFLSTKVRLRGKDIAFISVIVLVVFFLAVCWSSIKVDYRNFLNQQTGKQQVLVPFEKRVTVVTEMILDLDGQRFLEGIDALASRIAYVDMFARVINNVPRYLSHENGKLWWAAIRHVLMPRLLFPNKPVLPSDSELTSKYTRQHLAGGAQGTSISMGYMVESYIDFGMIGMYAPIFLCGLLWGGMYRYFMINVPDRPIAYGMVTALLINANQFEMHSVKLLGGMIMNFLVFALVTKFVLPRYLDRLSSRR